MKQSSLKLSALFSMTMLLVIPSFSSANETLKLEPSSKIVLIGNTLAERMQYENTFESLLHYHFPEHKLIVRNLGWSGDTIQMRLRSQDFQDHRHTLLDHQPDVILAFFGFNESFAGEAGLPAFEQDLKTFLDELKQLHYPSTYYPRSSTNAIMQDGTGTAEKTPQIVLISPIANEDLVDKNILAAANNENLKLYTAAMAEIAKEKQILFVDLFQPTLELSEDKKPLTYNGSHLSLTGQAIVDEVLAAALLDLAGHKTVSGSVTPTGVKRYQKIREAVAEKNLQVFYDYRAVNGYYIYGGRKNPYGVVNFPSEFAKLRKMAEVRDERIWSIAQGETVPDVIDDSQTGDVVEVVTNVTRPITMTTPEESAEMFTLPEGFEISLWASEVEFPDLQNPVQFAFDAKGRLWVTTMPSYPMHLPGEAPDDKVLILEDQDADGKADSLKIFADGLSLPTGFELGDGGAYVAQQPNLMFLKDTDGDDRADVRELRVHGFDSADSHHSISAFEWGPGGELYMGEGTFHHTQVETWQGLRRAANAAIFRYEPRAEKLDVFISYSFHNPWGICFDRWGQNFIGDASDGANYFAAAFSGSVDHPRQHPGMKQFLERQWRPTCGNEFVSSRHFPEEMQGDYLIANCIGFHGILQYRMQEQDSGFHATPVTPLLQSSDRNFRPVDLIFGPDGALYVLDWFNPLIGHMQHSLRDPNRDKIHGRIWRITHKDRPLVEPAKIAGQPVNELLELLKSPEDRTRYRARIELRGHETETVANAVNQWVSELDDSSEDYESLLLEAIWINQQHDIVNADLLSQLLNAQDGRVRAAAVRILCYWRDRVEEPLALLQAAVNDDHPRVRLEAIRALSFYDSQEALDIAVESLIHPQDEYLEYALNETLETLQRRIDQNVE